MVKREEIAWCPGCGNFAIRDVLEDVLKGLPVPHQKIVLTSGIGQAAKMPQYLDVNYFNGLHGRSIPLATGIKIARPDLTVIAYSGDGCMYGEGGNHLLHAVRRNIDITILVSDNHVYALTKGQSSPTTSQGVANPLTPQGNMNQPLNPLTLAVCAGAPFVARGFAGDKKELGEIIREAILFPGTALVDILQPCVTFNKINTFAWYRQRVYYVPGTLTDRYEAMKLTDLWGERIPLGILYRNDSRPCRTMKELFGRAVKREDIDCLVDMKCVMMR